jgi:hypothetical protein
MSIRDGRIVRQRASCFNEAAAVWLRRRCRRRASTRIPGTGACERLVIHSLQAIRPTKIESRERLNLSTLTSDGSCHPPVGQQFLAYTAASFDQLALEAPVLGNGLFTYAVREGLERQGAVILNGEISTKRLADFVGGRVGGWPRRSTPSRNRSSSSDAMRRTTCSCLDAQVADSGNWSWLGTQIRSGR